MEIEAPAQSPTGPLISLSDSAVGRMTVLIPTLKAATVMAAPRRSDVPMSAGFRPNADGIKDLGAGEPIAGLPTRHYRVTGIAESRFNLGDRVCVASQESTTELWTTTDPKFAEMHRHLRGLSARMTGAASIPLTGTDWGDIATLGPAVKSVMLNALPVRARRGDVTVTYELQSFSEGPLEASLFEPPEGYRLRDLTSFMAPERSDSLRVVSAKQMFDRMVDTTRVVPGVTTTCTASKAP
jgi:hypothetical protein